MSRHWQDGINGLLGAWIIVSPWVLQHTMPSNGGVAMWNLWTVGVAVLIIAAVALFAFDAWQEWTNVVLGVWLLISPWLLGFSTSAALEWNAVFVGALVAVFAGWALYDAQGSQEHHMAH